MVAGRARRGMECPGSKQRRIKSRFPPERQWLVRMWHDWQVGAFVAGAVAEAETLNGRGPGEAGV